MQFYNQEDIASFESVEFFYIKTALSGYILTITLNRPEKRNAFTPTMADEIIFALAYAHYNAKVRCVVIDAEGPVFCAGADLYAFQDISADYKNPTLPAIREDAKLGDAFEALLKPAIAKVKGPVLAGGFLIICGCTFVFSTPEATFGLPEVTRGIWPMQVMSSLEKIISPREILEMAIIGRSYSAMEALGSGLIFRIVGADTIDLETAALADLICENAPLAIQRGISAFQKMREIKESERHTFLKAELDLLLKTKDAQEGVLAFKEKRKPNWTGK